MSDRRLARTAGGTYYRRGSFNAWCQRCGRKKKAEELIPEWDGLKVCKQCYELRPAQDMVRGVVYLQAVPWAAPETADTWIIDATTQGLTTAPLNAGPEDLWDYSNTLSVQVFGGNLVSSQPLAVLNGANLCAVQTPLGGWEVLQFVTATLTAPMTYTLSQLLRGRVGTETSMMSPLAAGAPFAFIGTSNASNYDWLKLYLDVGRIPYSPIDFTCYEDNGDVVIQWIRRSRIPRLDQDNWATPFLFQAPMDCPDESYEVDVLDGAGNVLRTLHTSGSPTVTYEAADILTDFGSVQTSISIIGYQVDSTPGIGRGYGRPATLTVITSEADDTLGDGLGDVLCDEYGTPLGAQCPAH